MTNGWQPSRQRHDRYMPRRVLALGATSSIAQATLRLLAEKGASFWLVGRNSEKLAAVRADLLTRGAAAARIAAMDLDETAAHPAMLADAVAALGGIDLVLVAHGVLGDQKQAETDFAVAEKILRTNFVATASLIGLVANYLEQQQRASGDLHRTGASARGPVIAVISSVAGDRGRRSNYVYGASKGGLNVYLEGLRHRLYGTGIQVLIIKPGFVATPMTAHLPPSPLFAQPREVARHIVRAVEKRGEVAYVPPFWGGIMLVIRNLPGFIFKRLNF